MSDENPLVDFLNRADELGLEGEEKEDWVEGRMRRAGFKKGPGDWIRPEDDDEPQDDDDEPVTRADIRRMNRERVKTANSSSPPKVEKKTDPDTRKPARKGNNSNSWW